MSDTPRADLIRHNIAELGVFSRQLERELDAANTQIGLLVSGSKQQERQIEFLKETIHKLHTGAFEQRVRIKRLINAGNDVAKIIGPPGSHMWAEVPEIDRAYLAWNKAKEGL